ncbi:hypothetical protein CCR75_009343 [Bremia lactucae]|uniref:Uncharacterized protein n=1 Tax=Bremia lactucae TaxID=4779 RepID=A0A976IFB8_BRELC|nr:hypothetical protein CCR75_009343 [Bremia lactucae]
MVVVTLIPKFYGSWRRFSYLDNDARFCANRRTSSCCHGANASDDFATPPQKRDGLIGKRLKRVAN